jgi:MoxR-like ATPase
MPATENSAQLAFAPPVPHYAADLDIPWPLVVDLVARRLLLDGQSTYGSLSAELKIPVLIVEAVFRHFQKEQMAEIKGVSGSDFMIALTNAGRNFGAERQKNCHYAGPAPVSLNAYHRAVAAQAARPKVNRERLRSAMADLVVEEDILDKLGPALVSQKSLFLFGSTGNGKTSIAERLARVYDDAIVIPYAIEVDSQIITVYDPVVHERIEGDFHELDGRWVVCRRPEVMVGGELTPELLELRLDGLTNIYSAPVQLKANNGVLVIDDFGRQRMSPAELLNRWILPLDRKIDYLNLSYGLKFQVPFQLMIAFATNLEPTKLLDRAFLRRVPNKIYVHPVSDGAFYEIFRREGEKRGLAVTGELAGYLAQNCRRRGGRWLRACYPRDICDIVVSIDTYEERPVALTQDQLDRAMDIYFAESAETEEGPEML